MTKKELIKDIATATGTTQALVDEVVATFLAQVTKLLQTGKSVQLVGFGSLKKQKRAARTGRNPKTGERISIPAGVRVRFTASEKLLAAVK